MKDDPPLFRGLIALWLLCLLVILGGIKNAFSYSDSNLDISRVNFPLPFCQRDSLPEQRTGQDRQEKKTDIKKETPRGSESLEAIIQKYSERYSVSSRLVACIIFRESSNNPNAVGSAGEQGLCQFKIGTWRSFRKQMGESQEVSPFNPEEAVKTLAWALSKGYGNHWSVFWRCK